MHRIGSKQGGALLEIAFATGSHNDGAKPHDFTRTGSLDQQPGHQSTDSAKSVQHYVLGFLDRLLLLSIEISQLLLDEIINILRCRSFGLQLFHESNGELTQIYLGMP